MSLIKDFYIEHNIWELHEELKYITGFKVIYEKDKSKNKEKSSKVAWAIILAADETENNKFYLSCKDQTERMELIKKNYLKDKSFSWRNHEERIDAYREWSLTAEEKQLNEFDDLIEDRDKAIREGDYDKAASMDKVIKGYKDVIETRKTLERLAKDSEVKERVAEGKKKLSIDEQGLI